MRKLGTFLIFLGIGIIGLQIIAGIWANYEYKKKVESFWNLADKSSTISEKSLYIDEFVNALENENLQGTHDAIIFKNNDNSFDYNFKALKSLQSRLQEIETMDIKSFEYQTAIQQITQQEQGEAYKMLCDISGAWHLKNFPIIWDWLCLVGIGFSSLSILFGSFIREQY